MKTESARREKYKAIVLGKMVAGEFTSYDKLASKFFPKNDTNYYVAWSNLKASGRLVPGINAGQYRMNQ